MEAKKELIYKLKEQGAFWSYSKKGLGQIPDSTLIEQTLRMGDVPEIQQLFDLFPLQKIKQVWHEKLIPDQRIYPHNYYLAKIFFDVERPAEYITPLQKQYDRYERIKNADA